LPEQKYSSKNFLRASRAEVLWVIGLTATNATCKPWRRLDIWRSLTLSSSGLGHRPFTAVTRVRIPLGSHCSFIGEMALEKDFSCVFGHFSDSIRAVKHYGHETKGK